MDPVIIYTAGRTGSTLLLRAMNLARNVYIFGEHNGFLSHIHSSFAAIEQNAEEQKVFGDAIALKDGSALQGRFSAWATPFSPLDLRRSLASAIERLFTSRISQDWQGSFVWGFKEIRYDASSVAYFADMYPSNIPIVLIRDIKGYATSWYRAFNNNGRVDRFRVSRLVSSYVLYFRSVLDAHALAGITPEIVRYEHMQRDLPSLIERVQIRAGIERLPVSTVELSRVFAERVDYVSPSSKSYMDEHFAAFEMMLDEEIEKRAGTIDELLPLEEV